MLKDCDRPGGPLDPKKEDVWKAYARRRDEPKNLPAYVERVKKEKAAREAGKGGKGGKGDKKGKGGKSTDKGKSGGKGKGDRAATVLCPVVARASTPSEKKFPRNGIGLDTWANVHMQHQRAKGSPSYPDTIFLANGTEGQCLRDVGWKGVPRCRVPWVEQGENIDLFPEGFLWERGCDINRGAQHTITSPKGRLVQIKVWGSLPYILKEDLNRLLDDLPEIDQPGRHGEPTFQPTVFRVCSSNCTPSQVRDQLRHLKLTESRKQLNNICSKIPTSTRVIPGFRGV
jgi:hypothetical protein